MMISIKQRYAELLSLTQLFLFREFSMQEIKIADPAAVNFFKTKRKDSPSPLPKLAPAPLLPPSHASSQPALPLAKHPIPRSLPPEQTIISKSPSSSSSLTPPQLQSAPPPPITQEKTKAIQGKEFILEPFTKTSSNDYRDFWKLSRTLFPEWKLCETIPNDMQAQKTKKAWLHHQEIPSVMILSFQDNEQHLTFLTNIAKAITLRLAPARVVSVSSLEEEKWENILNSSHLRLVIASDYGLYLHPKLMQFYREVPLQNKHFLQQTPLLLLSDLSLYLKEPQLKALLWRAICNEFATLKVQH